jgi:hypothetical protein
MKRWAGWGGDAGGEKIACVLTTSEPQLMMIASEEAAVKTASLLLGTETVAPRS